MTQMTGRFLCSIGLHWFGEIQEEPVRSAGRYDGKDEFVVQKGVETCTRQGCGHQHKVWRQGWTGTECFPGEMGPWIRMGPEEEEYVESLEYRRI